MKTWHPSSVLALLLLAGCAARAPIVDMKGVDERKYQADLAECREYAEKALGAGSGAAGGAVVGAGIGYVLGRAVGANDPSAVGRGGAVMGGARGAGKGAQSRKQIVANCLKGRGYKVLD